MFHITYTVDKMVTWKNISHFGTRSMNPSISLLYYTLKHFHTICLTHLLQFYLEILWLVCYILFRYISQNICHNHFIRFTKPIIFSWANYIFGKYQSSSLNLLHLCKRKSISTLFLLFCHYNYSKVVWGVT